MTALPPQLLENARKHVQVAALRGILSDRKNFKKHIPDLLNPKTGLLPVKISTRRMCNDETHCSQHHFMTEILSRWYPEILVWANRGGSKTYLISLADWILSIVYPGLETSLLGGSEEQARKAYKAMGDFWAIGDAVSFDLKRCYAKSVAAENTRLKNGSITSILTASENSVRGPHTQLLIIDEIDATKKELIDSAKSIPQSNFLVPGIPGMTWQMSTNHVAGGNMDEAIERIQKNSDAGYFRWCIWDCLEACNGACSTCPLTTWCPGPQMKEATGYYKIEDFIQKLYSLDLYTLMVEWFCQKIGSPDLVYAHEFDPDIHIVDAQFDPTRMARIAVDWGGINAFAVVVFQDFRDVPGVNAWVAVDEIYMPNSTTPAVIAEMKKRPWFANHLLYAVCDHNQDANKQLRESKRDGVDVRLAKKDVETGIARVKAMLKPVLGPPRFKIARRCKNTIREFLSYRQKNGRIVKGNDHTCDAVQYFFAGLDEEIGGSAVAIRKTEDS